MSEPQPVLVADTVRAAIDWCRAMGYESPEHRICRYRTPTEEAAVRRAAHRKTRVGDDDVEKCWCGCSSD